MSDWLKTFGLELRKMDTINYLQLKVLFLIRTVDIPGKLERICVQKAFFKLKREIAIFRLNSDLEQSIKS